MLHAHVTVVIYSLHFFLFDGVWNCQCSPVGNPCFLPSLGLGPGHSCNGQLIHLYNHICIMYNVSVLSLYFSLIHLCYHGVVVRYYELSGMIDHNESDTRMRYVLEQIWQKQKNMSWFSLSWFQIYHSVSKSYSFYKSF